MPAYESLQAHMPQEVLEIIDTGTLKPEKESFVEPDLSTDIADILFLVKLNNRPISKYLVFYY